MSSANQHAYRKKPVVIEAYQLKPPGTSRLTVPKWLIDGFNDGSIIIDTEKRELHIKTLEGVMIASEGDWIIRGVKGEVYPCKPDIFEATYERA